MTAIGIAILMWLAFVVGMMFGLELYPDHSKCACGDCLET